MSERSNDVFEWTVEQLKQWVSKHSVGRWHRAYADTVRCVEELEQGELMSLGLVSEHGVWAEQVKMMMDHDADAPEVESI